MTNFNNLFDNRQDLHDAFNIDNISISLAYRLRQNYNDRDTYIQIIQQNFRIINQILGTYLYAYDFNDGLASVRYNNGQWGYITSNGDILLDCIYDMAYNFNDGIATVMLNNNWGVIDTQGNFTPDN